MKLQTFNWHFRKLLITGVAILGGMVAVNVIRASVAKAKMLERTLTVYEQEFPSEVLQIVDVKNLQSPTFPADLKIDFKNVSKKTISYVKILLSTPPEKAVERLPVFVFLVHGTPRADNLMPGYGPLSLQPGETLSAQLSPAMGAGTAKGFKRALEQGKLTVDFLSAFRVRIATVECTDGTFYRGRREYLPGGSENVQEGTRPVSQLRWTAGFLLSSLTLGSPYARLGSNWGRQPLIVASGQPTRAKFLCEYDSDCGGAGSPCKCRTKQTTQCGALGECTSWYWNEGGGAGAKCLTIENAEQFCGEFGPCQIQNETDC